MSYQVIARRWRPQKLDDVVGQRAVTQTLRNAVTQDRIGQAFVFAGPRGVGKTTTARILARMLNCEHGPTADPCGACDSCREIAEGRDIDVLEIDAATHTQVDNVREVIISGLAMRPVRDRYKVFIIDEVHQLSSHSFNALLKSIEEPPPHVAFIMATTAPDKIPDTIISRAQVFEFRTISSKAIADQLRKIAAVDGLTASDEAVALVARAAEGSMRDAETAFDQVIAFAGTTISVEDVATVLGLVGRDLLFDVVTAVADENAPAAFELAGRAVEAGYDLRMLCRELSRLVRDLMVLLVDPQRITDPDIAPEGDRGRLQALLPRFSREDLLRAFDQLSRAEMDIRNSTEPRHQLEMALLRWMHLRKLAPLAEIIERLQSGALPGPAAPPSRAPATGPSRPGAMAGQAFTPRPPAAAPMAPPRPLESTAARVAAARSAGTPAGPPAPRRAGPPASASNDPDPSAGSAQGGSLKDRVLAEIQRARPVLYGSVVAQAQKIVAADNRLVFTFSPTHRILADQVGQQRGWLEELATKLAGRRVAVSAEVGAAADSSNGGAPGGTAQPGSAAPPPGDLKADALASPGVQALLEIFPVEIRDVEEIKDR